MKINLTIFKKEFFGVEVESDTKLSTGLDLAKPNSEETVQQLQYVMTDVQCDQLRAVHNLIEELGVVKMLDDWDTSKKEEMKRNYRNCKNLLTNIISSYEHFKEKREALSGENKDGQ